MIDFLYRLPYNPARLGKLDILRRRDMPELSVLLQGSPLRTDVGIVGFCSVVLIEGEKRILVDVGHVGRRSALENALKARGPDTGGY